MITEDPRPADGPTTTWDYIDGQWVERELTEAELAVRYPPKVTPPRPADTETTTWDWDPEAWVWVQRPMAPDELAAKTQEVQRAATKSEVNALIDALQTERARVQPIIDKTSAQVVPNDTKDVARALKRTIDAMISMARFVKGD